MNEHGSKQNSNSQRDDAATRLPRLRRLLLRPRMVAAFVVVAVVGLNASGAFGLNALGLHSALTTSSLPTGFQSASSINYGFLAETTTTCSAFGSGNGQAITGTQYSVKSSKISQTNPGVFFYFIPVTSTGTSDKFTIVESVTNPPTTNKAGQTVFFTMVNAGTQVFNNPSCTAVSGETITPGSATGAASGGYTITVTNLPAGTYFIAIKYQTGSVIGDTPPGNPTGGGTANYSFATFRNGIPVANSAVGPLPFSKK